ncbi:MAG: hypothetical protein J3R72DRAFT_259450 [Linnemannia gamsii]|nr:MAG: hypothetical protein J3R72DRAFT_259450 [Linnemannia gamsii]
MSYSYPYTAHLLDKVGESSGGSRARSVIPPFAPLDEVEAQNNLHDSLNEGSAEGASHRNQDNHNTQRTRTNKQTERQTQHQHQLQPITSVSTGSAVASGPGSKSRKRKAKQPLQPQPPPPPVAIDPEPIINEQAAPPPPATIRSELEWARYNNMQEADAVFNGQQVRRANLNPTTLKAYDIYREHWLEWCRNHHYRDYAVTNSRAARYFQEAFGEPDPLNPQIKPLRRQKARKDELGDYLMPETMDFYIKAVVDLWNEQATSAPNGVHPGAEVSPRKIARPFMEAYKRKIGALTKATKFKGLRITEGNNKQGFKRMMKSFWTRNYVQQDQKNRRKLNGLRDRLNLSWTHFMMCRGENMRMALLQDLNFHAFEFSDATGQFTLGIVLTMLQGKMNADGKLLYGLVVRNKDVEICPVGSSCAARFQHAGLGIQLPRICNRSKPTDVFLHALRCSEARNASRQHLIIQGHSCWSSSRSAISAVR